MPLGDSVVYVLDADDRLRWVGSTWDASALAHGATSLCAASALGSSLWSHIGDVTVAELYRLILERVRTGRLVNVPFDGSDRWVQREMRLHLRPLQGGLVECVSTVVKEQRDWQARVRAVADAEPPMLLTVCSWCGRLQVGAEWREIDVAVTALRVFMGTSPGVISHGACPTCAARLTDEVDFRS